jgi:hypothetical protein
MSRYPTLVCEECAWGSALRAPRVGSPLSIGTSMRCSHGRQTICEGVRFYPASGNPLAWIRPPCCNLLPPRAACRNHFGTSLAGTVPSGALLLQAPRSQTPQVYTSKAGLEGECKQVTVLGAHRKRSMKLSADRSGLRMPMNAHCSMRRTGSKPSAAWPKPRIVPMTAPGRGHPMPRSLPLPLSQTVNGLNCWRRRYLSPSHEGTMLASVRLYAGSPSLVAVAAGSSMLS